MSTNKNTRVDTITLKPSEFKAALEHAASVGRPVFIWGPPGIGKSQISRQVADELGFNFFEDIRLSQMDPTDLRGIPVPSQDEEGNAVARWSPPHFYRRQTLRPDGGKAFYMFDEMNSAPQSIQAAAYQIVLDRRIGDFKLGPNDFVMAAGNRETDKGATFKMPTPLMNRFVHLELRVDFEDWQEHALSKMFDKNVVGYLTFQKKELFEFDASSASRGFPTPRSWEFVSDLVKGSPNLPENVLLALIAGAVGEGVAIKFLQYRKTAAQLPNPSDILSGKVTELKSKEISVMYALTTGLCYELREAHEAAKRGDKGLNIDAWYKQADNFLGFMLDNFQPELCILGARTALSVFRLPLNPMKLKSWDRFAERYMDLILKA